MQLVLIDTFDDTNPPPPHGNMNQLPYVLSQINLKVFVETSKDGWIRAQKQMQVKEGPRMCQIFLFEFTDQ